MQTKYGHFRVEFHNNQFTFVPSFRAMLKIGDKSDVMSVISDLYCLNLSEYLSSSKNHHPYTIELINKYEKKKAGRAQLSAAHLVLSSCCEDDCSPMVGKYIFKDKIYYQPGFESPKVLIELAQHLLNHGVVGVTKNKVVKSKSSHSQSFDPLEFVELAQLKLRKTKDEALDMTMTEFLSNFVKEYPPSESDEFAATTEDEADDFYRMCEEFRAKVKAKEESNG